MAGTLVPKLRPTFNDKLLWEDLLVIFVNESISGKGRGVMLLCHATGVHQLLWRDLFEMPRWRQISNDRLPRVLTGPR
jgi:hypothetical protein